MVHIKGPYAVPPTHVVTYKQNGQFFILKTTLDVTGMKRSFHFPDHIKSEKRVKEKVMFSFYYQRFIIK